jgi:Ca2+-binding RTX toxin-like protein
VFAGPRSNYLFESPDIFAGPDGYLRVTNITDGTVDYVLFVERLEFADQTILTSTITGTRGTYLDETFSGTSAADSLAGSFGNDVINGLAGNDSLLGGVDWLFHDPGNSGNDILNGGAGDDWLDGGDGNDIINGGEGVDRTLLVFQSDQAVNFTLSANPTLTTQFGSKTLSSIEGADIGGGDLADTITGGSAHDFVSGAGGNDTINGVGGDDWLDGGNGDDRVFGGAGNDQITGGDDNGADILTGGGGNDWLIGAGGDDRLEGNQGADILVGGAGSDRLSGGSGADIFAFGQAVLGTSRAGQHDLIVDFQRGSDKIDLSALYTDHAIGAVSAGSAAAGETVGDYGIVYNISSGRTVVYGDNDGVAGADFVIELSGSIALARSDIIGTEADWNTATGGIDYHAGDGFLHSDVTGAPYYWFFSIGVDA